MNKPDRPVDNNIFKEIDSFTDGVFGYMEENNLESFNITKLRDGYFKIDATDKTGYKYSEKVEL